MLLVETCQRGKSIPAALPPNMLTGWGSAPAPGSDTPVAQCFSSTNMMLMPNGTASQIVGAAPYASQESRAFGDVFSNNVQEMSAAPHVSEGSHTSVSKNFNSQPMGALSYVSEESNTSMASVAHLAIPNVSQTSVMIASNDISNQRGSGLQTQRNGNYMSNFDNFMSQPMSWGSITCPLPSPGKVLQLEGEYSTEDEQILQWAASLNPEMLSSPVHKLQEQPDDWALEKRPNWHSVQQAGSPEVEFQAAATFTFEWMSFDQDPDDDEFGEPIIPASILPASALTSVPPFFTLSENQESTAFPVPNNAAASAENMEPHNLLTSWQTTSPVRHVSPGDFDLFHPPSSAPIVRPHDSMPPPKYVLPLVSISTSSPPLLVFSPEKTTTPLLQISSSVPPLAATGQSRIFSRLNSVAQDVRNSPPPLFPPPPAPTSQPRSVSVAPMQPLATTASFQSKSPAQQSISDLPPIAPPPARPTTRVTSPSAKLLDDIDHLQGLFDGKPEPSAQRIQAPREVISNVNPRRVPPPPLRRSTPPHISSTAPPLSTPSPPNPYAGILHTLRNDATPEQLHQQNSTTESMHMSVSPEYNSSSSPSPSCAQSDLSAQETSARPLVLLSKSSSVRSSSSKSCVPRLWFPGETPRNDNPDAKSPFKVESLTPTLAGSTALFGLIDGSRNGGVDLLSFSDSKTKANRTPMEGLTPRKVHVGSRKSGDGDASMKQSAQNTKDEEIKWLESRVQSMQKMLESVVLESLVTGRISQKSARH